MADKEVILMGYIAPITQFEYIQYANRTVNAEKQQKKDVQGVKPVMAVPFIQELEKQTAFVEKDEEEGKFRNRSNKIPVSNAVPSLKGKVPGPVLTRTNADLTGKGGIFSITI
jgi:hypothetical protein